MIKIESYMSLYLKIIVNMVKILKGNIRVKVITMIVIKINILFLIVFSLLW